MPKAKPTKKRAAKKKAASKKKKSGSKKKSPAKTAGKVSRLEKYNEQGAELVDLVGNDVDALPKAAKKLGMSLGKAKRLHARAILAPKDRVPVDGMDEKELAATIVKLRDDDGLAFMPDIWARTGLGPARIKTLYKKGGGTGSPAPRESGGKKSKKSKAAKKAGGGGRKKRSGIGGRSLRRRNKELLEELWNLDTTEDRVKEILEGRAIEVSRTMSGRSMRPVDYKVHSVKKVVDAPTTGEGSGGKVVHFNDTDQKSRVINFREISAVK